MNLIDLINGKDREPRMMQRLEAFWGFTQSLSSLSTCKRASVGCTVVDPRMLSIHAIGYNGPPAGIDNDSCRALEGNCGCVHAEASALIKLRHVPNKLVLLTTFSPCEHCAGLIVNSGCIDAVIYGTPYRDARGISILLRSGIPNKLIFDLQNER